MKRPWHDWTVVAAGISLILVALTNGVAALAALVFLVLGVVGCGIVFGPYAPPSAVKRLHATFGHSIACLISFMVLGMNLDGFFGTILGIAVLANLLGGGWLFLAPRIGSMPASGSPTTDPTNSDTGSTVVTTDLSRHFVRQTLPRARTIWCLIALVLAILAMATQWTPDNVRTSAELTTIHGGTITKYDPADANPNVVPGIQLNSSTVSGDTGAELPSGGVLVLALAVAIAALFVKPRAQATWIMWLPTALLGWMSFFWLLSFTSGFWIGQWLFLPALIVLGWQFRAAGWLLNPFKN